MLNMLCNIQRFTERLAPLMFARESGYTAFWVQATACTFLFGGNLL